jgi:uncharacterized protein YjbI with pentapeptide repeats
VARKGFQQENLLRGAEVARLEAKRAREAAGIHEDGSNDNSPDAAPQSERRGPAARAPRIAGPPTFSAETEVENARSRLALARNAGTDLPELRAQLDDRAYETRMRGVERRLKDGYRKSGHVQDPAERLSREASQPIRDRVADALSRGASLAEWDLTGADLSDMDLSSANFANALLECASLTGARLDGANFRAAMLARANCKGASFRQADFSEANLAYADLSEARLDDARLTATNLERAVLAKTSFVGAKLLGVNIENHAAQADFSRVFARKATVTKSSFDQCRFAGADWEKCTFVECDLRGCHFDGARLERTTFLQCKLDGASFVGAHLHRLRAVHHTTAARAVFRGANLTLANLRNIDLDSADFTEADATGADFSESTLRGAIFRGAAAKEARFVRSVCDAADFSGANLMFAILQKASLDGASFARSNLFRADLSRARGDDATSFAGAHVVQALALERARR